MTRAGPWLGASLSVVIAAVALGAFVASGRAASSAEGTRDNALRLKLAREQVAESEGEIGESDLESAVASAREANATAERVGRVTERIASLLARTDAVAASIAASSRRGVRSTSVTRRQTQLAARILAWIAGYQRDSARFSALNNRALERSLRALRETNRSFPGLR